EDDQQRERHDERETLACALEILELAGPLEVIPGRELDAFGDGSLCFIDVTAQVASSDINEHEARKRALLVVYRRRCCREAKVRELGEWDLCAVAGAYEHTLQRVDVAPVVTEVPDVDTVTLAPLDGLRHRGAADRRFDDVLDIADGHPVARYLIAIDVEIE